MVTESQHIDYHFSGLEDDDGDDEVENNDDDGSEVHTDGELSFENRENDKDTQTDSSPVPSSEVIVSFVYVSNDHQQNSYTPCANVSPQGNLI